ncbi:MAG TPA: sigma-70 family RNA polymerase sigma factor [Dehalococcoidia bacterium]|jgi:RNA polymerase sigma-70 factor (ECF subfamily)|nr:sigma-70 family RNA polymerase sigma factor [Dehalococcoidia bacterium]
MRASLFESSSDADRRSSDEDSESVQRDLEAARRGDPAVWDRWFTGYYPPLYRYAFYRLRREADAEEIASQVFVEAYRGIRKYRYTGKPILAWLYRIAHNLVCDRIDHEQRRRRTHIEDGDLAESCDGPESGVANIDLMNALDALSDDQREVIVLRFFMGMQGREVAATTGKSAAAVFSLQARAIVSLRQRLGEDFVL